MNNSLAQLQPYAPPNPAAVFPRFNDAARSQGDPEGLKGARQPLQRASTDPKGCQARENRAPPLQIVREGRGSLDSPTRLLAPVARLQQTGAASGASREADSRRPRGVFEAFAKTCQRWRLDRDQQAVLLGFPPPSTLAGYVLTGKLLSTSVDVRDRAVHVFGISLGLGALFDEDPDVENEWLRTPRAQFANRSPLDHMLEGHMNHLLAVAELVRRERGL